MQSQTPTAKNLYWRLLIIAMMYPPIVVGMVTPVLAFGTGLTGSQLRTLAIMLPLFVVPATVIVDIAFLTLFYHPIRAGLRDVETNGTNQTLRRNAYTRMMNFSVITFLRVSFIHTPTGVIAGYIALIIANRYFDMGIATWQVLTISSAPTVAGISHAILEYFSVQYIMREPIVYMRNHLSEPDDTLHSQLISVGIRPRLFFVAVWTFMMPFVIAALVTTVRISNPENLRLQQIIAYYTGLFFAVLIVTIITAYRMSGEMKHLIGQVLDGMQHVRDGQFTTHLESITTDEFASLYRGFNRMTAGLAERERLHDAFGRYVSPELAKQIATEGAKLSGGAVHATVMFADIRGFTAMSEKLTPADVVAILNRFFAMVEPVITENGGWINKFLGDGFMVTFGAPVAYNDHAQRAVNAALGIRRVLDDFNAQQIAANAPTIRIGIGIESGEMVAGSIGSPERIEYTVIGDTVNVASRIESLNKEMETELLISENVYSQLTTDVSVRAMPPAQVKGKSEPVLVYELVYQPESQSPLNESIT